MDDPKPAEHMTEPAARTIESMPLTNEPPGGAEPNWVVEFLSGLFDKTAEEADPDLRHLFAATPAQLSPAADSPP